MAFDPESNRYFEPAVKGERPSGHISMPGRADIDDCINSPNGVSVSDIETALDKTTRGMTDSQAAYFERIVIEAAAGHERSEF